MPNIILGNQQLTYQLRRSKCRRSVQVKIVPPGNLEVLAPEGLPHAEIEKILRHRSSWIATHMTRMATQAANPVNSALIEGAALLYLGLPRKLVLEESPTTRAKVTVDDHILTVHLPKVQSINHSAVLEETLRKWYIRVATKLLADKTAYWAQQLGVRPQRITIREQKTRWGSASQLGNVNYNWRIIMAPTEIIDYLVVHELCHIKVPNHSAAFWQLVGQSISDYKGCRLWLRQNGAILTRLLSKP